MLTILRIFIFWLLVFAAFRLGFLLGQPSEWPTSGDQNVWASLWYGLPLDFSTAGYLTLLPALLWFAGCCANASWTKLWTRCIQWVLGFELVLVLLVFGSNFFIYQEWHTLLNYRAVAYLSTPDVLVNSMSYALAGGVIALLTVMLFLFWKLKEYMVGSSFFKKVHTFKTLGWLPVSLGLLLLAIRGWGEMPINESAVYYANHAFCNHAATNPGWHLIHSLLEAGSNTNHYQTDEGDPALLAPKLLRQYRDTLDRKVLDLTATPRPNIVFILMESMTAQVVGSFGGEPGVTPHLDALTKESLSFTDCYGSGYRTDQGLVSALAGYPAQPDQSIIFQMEKAAQLMSLPKLLKEKRGYAHTFIHGSELTFGNFKVWLTGQNADPIIGKGEFPMEQRRQRWGADDHFILQRTIEEIDQLPQPFFATALTVSLHPPFDAPFEHKWPGNDLRAQFLNSAHFADQELAVFFDIARTKPWYKNTVFVLVADHGSPYPSNLGMDLPATRKVPLVIFSPLLQPAWRGRQMEMTCGQHDLPTTLLAMLGQDSLGAQHFPRSRDIFGLSAWAQEHPEDAFAYYTNEDGLGWVTPRGRAFYRFKEKKWTIFEGEVDSQGAKAYLHLLYDDFLTK